MNIIKPFQPAKGIVPTVRSISTLSGDIQGDFPELRDGELTYRQDPAAGELLLMLLEALKQFRAQSGGSISISNSTSVIRNNICSIVNNFRSAAVGTAGLELLLKKIGEVFSSEAPEAPSPQSAELLIKQLSGQIEKMGISPKDHAAMVSELRGGISGADMERAAGNTLKKNSELTARLYSGKIHIHRLFDRSGGMNGIYSTYSTYSTYGESGMSGTDRKSGMNSAGGGRSGAAVGIIGSAEIGGDSLKRFFGGFKAMLPRGGQTEQIEAASADTAVPAFTSITSIASIAAITAKGADHSAGNKVFSNRSRVLRGTQESTVWERNGSISRGGKGGCKRLTELVFSNRFSGSETPDTERKNTAADIPAGSGAAHADVRSYPESDAGSIPPVTDHSGKNTAYGLFTRLSDRLSAQIFTKLSAQLSGEPRGEITGITGGSAGAVPAAVPAVFNLYAAYPSDLSYAAAFAREMRERFRNTPAARYEGLGQVKENTLSYFRSFVKNTKWYYDMSNKSTDLRRGHSAAEIPPVSGGAVMTASDPVGASRSELPVIPETSEIRKSHESRERYEIREIIRDQEKPSFVMAEFTRNYAPELFGGLLTEKTAFRFSVPENRGGDKRGISNISLELIYLNRYSFSGVGNGENGSPDTRRSGATDNKADRLKPDHFAGAENADNMGSARSERIFKFDKSEISYGSAEFTAYSGNARKPEATDRMKADGKHGGSISAAELYRSLVLKGNPVTAGELFRYREAYPAGLSAAFTDIDKTLRSNVSSGLKVSGGSARLARLAHTAGLARVQNNLYNLNNLYNPGDLIGSILPGAKLLNNNSVRSIVFSRFSNFPHFTHFPRFSHFSLMQSASGQSKAGHSAFSLAARDSMTWLTDQTARITSTALTARTSPTVRTAQTAPTAPTALNKSNVSNKVNVLNVLNVPDVLNEMNKLTTRAASVLRSEIRGRLSERIVFSEKAEMLNIRSVSEISGYFPEYAVNDFSLPGSDRRETFPSPRLTDISGTPGFNEPGYSARHTESAPAGHEEYDRAVGADQRKWEYLRSVRAEYIKIVRAQNSLNRKTFLSPERYRAAFPGNVGEIAADAADKSEKANKSNKVNKANIADAALQAIEANRYIGGNIYRIPARGSESFPERAAAPAVYKPGIAGAGASPEKPVYPAIASVSGAFPISLKGFARRLILMERSRSGDTESLITVNTSRKSSLLERLPGGGAYLDAEYADRKSGKSVRNGTNGASGIIEQNPDVYRDQDTASGSSAGGENALYYYSAAVPEKSGGNAQELPADRDIQDKGDKGAEVSNEVPLPPAERIYSQLNISERVSALLSSEEAMKSYIMNQINSYFSENNSHNANSLIQNQYNSADMLCEQVISRLERRLKTERRINGR